MEEQKMNEKESLEFIAQMIRVTKQSIGSGSGNKFLMYGYTAAILSIVIYALVYFTGNSAWSWPWCAGRHGRRGRPRRAGHRHRC